MTKDLCHIINRCFVNIPFDRLSRHDELIRTNRIQPEIGLEGDILYKYKDQDFVEKARLLEGEGLRCTLHAPFSDLSPGARDRRILQASRDKLRRERCA